MTPHYYPTSRTGPRSRDPDSATSSKRPTFALDAVFGRSSVSGASRVRRTQVAIPQRAPQCRGSCSVTPTLGRRPPLPTSVHRSAANRPQAELSEPIAPKDGSWLREEELCRSLLCPMLFPTGTN